MEGYKQAYGSYPEKTPADTGYGQLWQLQLLQGALRKMSIALTVYTVK